MRKIFYAFIMTSIIFLIACHKDSNLGYDILPGDDIIHPEIIDTFSIQVYTMPEDTILANYASTLLLGEYIDPIFGRTKAEFVSQFGLSEYPTFNSGSIVDSAFLQLTLDTNAVHSYGTQTAPQIIKVYRLPDSFDSEKDYYSNHDTSEFMSGDLIGIYNFDPSSEDVSIRIPLYTSQIESFIEAPESVWSSSESFIDFFKGIYVTSQCDDGDAAIYKFKLSSGTIIRMFYHEDGIADVDSFSVSANVSAAKKFNLFQHDYSSTSFYDQIGDDQSPQDSVAYVQAMGGLRVKIVIPGLAQLKEMGDIAIYKAELIVKTAASSYTYDTQYEKMKYMVLAGIDPENEFYLLPEYFTGTSYLPQGLEDNEYRFQIASYIRELIDGDTENDGLWLFPYAASDNYTRSVITTGNHSTPMKLIITYTKL